MSYSHEVEQAMRALYATFSERDRRRYAAIEAAKLGHGGITYISSVLGCSYKTIRRGQHDLSVLDDVSVESAPGARAFVGVLLHVVSSAEHPICRDHEGFYRSHVARVGVEPARFATSAPSSGS